MDDKQPNPPSRKPESEPDSFWQLLAQATNLGWNLVVPIVGGVLLGRYLDDLFGKDFTWTVSLLLLGVLVAFNNLYAIYVEHGRPESLRKRGKKRRREESEESETHAEDK